MKKRIAFFDFDGTITTKDTLLEIIRYHKGTRAFYLGFILYSPFLVAYKIGLIPNYFAKQLVLRHFFGKMKVDIFQAKCDEFTYKVLPSLIRPKAMHEIEILKQEDVEIVVVSASAENWTRKWCDDNGIKNLATKLEIRNGAITGRITGKNCHGEEKVCRIESEYRLSDYAEIYAYGDTSGDKPMLRIATHSFYKPFR